MDNKQPWFSQVNKQFNLWLNSVKHTELLDVQTFIRQTKENVQHAEQISEEKLTQLVKNLQHDFSEFYVQTKAEAKHSLYLSLLAETGWQKLAEMTDKSQVEWAELADDIVHHGEYQCGDVIGFGILQCQQCFEHLHVTHMSEVKACLHCGHQKFNRVLLEP